MRPRRTTRLVALVPAIVIAAALINAPGASAAPPQPSISSFSPTSGVPGTQVQIRGSDFIGVTSVDFDGAPASFVANSHTMITTAVPTGATTGPITVSRNGSTSTSASIFTVPTSDPDLTLSMKESADPVVADSTLAYTLTVQNVGGSPADGTGLVDTLPSAVIYESATDSGTYDASANTVMWNLGTVGPGATITETLVVQPIHPAFPMTNSAQVSTTSPDPGSPNGVTTDTEVDPQPGTRYVSVSDTASTPPYRGLALGETIQWDFLGPSNHEITDSHGLGYLDTGPHSAISYARFTFDLSAEIRTQDLPAFPANLGKITVPPQVTPDTGTTTDSFLVVWALQQPPPNIVEDVQIKRPGAARWTRWRPRQSLAIQDRFVPDAGPGTYEFRSRIRNVANRTHSRFGPPVPITVS
jgi:uncharacterized repeat protein (TIGR01451 family)